MSDQPPAFKPDAQPLEPHQPPSVPDNSSESKIINQQYWIIITLAMVLMCSLCSLILVIGGINADEETQAAAPQPQAEAGGVSGEQAEGALGAAPQQPADSVQQEQAVPQEQAPTDLPPTNTPRPRPTAEPDPVGFSINNPAPEGTTVSLPNYDVALLGSRLPVDDELFDMSFLNVPSEDRLEFLRVTVRVTCKLEECDFWPAIFDVQGSSGLIYERRLVLFSVDNSIDFTEMKQNATLTGDLYFEVPENESGFTLRWEPAIGDIAYFDLPY